MFLQRGTRPCGLCIGRNNHSIRIRRRTTINRPLLNRRRKKIRRYGVVVFVVRLLRERVRRRLNRLLMMRGGALFNHREKPICERFFEEENTRNSERVTRRYGLHKNLFVLDFLFTIAVFLD